MVFDSVYEIMTASGTVRKTRMIEFFDGELLDSRWVFTNITGTGSSAMVTGADNGFAVTTGATSGNQSTISYGGTAPSHFCTNAAIMIAILERPVTSMSVRAGLAQGPQLCNACCNHVVASENDTNDTNYQITTEDGTCLNSVCTCTAVDTTRRVHKIELKTCDADLFLCGGTADATSSCNLPNAPLQPVFHVLSRASGTKSGRISYMEVYNT